MPANAACLRQDVEHGCPQAPAYGTNNAAPWRGKAREKGPAMPQTDLVITVIRGAAVVIFRAASILDTQLVEAIGKELYELVDGQAHRRLVLDFHSVRGMSSQMLGVLINLQKKCQAIKGRMIICGLRSELLKVFKVTRLESLFTFAENEEKALNEFGVFTTP